MKAEFSLKNKKKKKKMVVMPSPQRQLARKKIKTY
jgi:hypothetical protein